MKRYFVYIAVCIFVLACCPVVSKAAWVEAKPDKEESASVGFDYAKNNNIFLKALGTRLFGYYSGSSYYLGWSNSDAATAKLIGPVISGAAVPSAYAGSVALRTGDMFWNTATKQLLIYDGTSYIHQGSYLPNHADSNAATTAMGACGAGTLGRTYFDTTDKVVKTCSNISGSYAYGNIGDLGEPGVTSLTGYSGAATSGVVKILGGTGISTASDAAAKTVTISADTTYSFKQEQIQSVTPGNTGSPFTECVGANDYDTICLMKFAGTGTTIETITFQWASGSALNEAEDIVVYIYGMIQVAPTAQTSQAKFGLKFYGTDGTDPIITSDTYTLQLYSGGSVAWPAWTNGSPYATAGVVKYFTITIAAGEIPADTFGTFSLFRNAEDGDDTYTSNFGVSHIIVETYNEN